MPKRTTTTARKPRSQPKAVAQEVAVVEQSHEVGDLVYLQNSDQKAWEVIQIEGEDVWLEDPLLPDSTVLAHLSRLKPWEFKYYPGQWVKVKGEVYPRYIFEVRHFKTEPDDGLRYYDTKLAPWLDDVTMLGQSQIEYVILEPEWVNLCVDDRVAESVFSGEVKLTGTTESFDDDLTATVRTDLGELVKVDSRDLSLLPLFFKIGDRVTEDINTENAYKEGWASEQNRTHGTIVHFIKNSGKFYPQIRTADGSLHTVNPAHLQPYAGGEALSEPEPTEPPMTAEQVIEEMEQAMCGESEVVEKSDSLSDNSAPITVEVLPSDTQAERLTTLEQQIQHGIDQIESGRSAIWQAVAEVQQQGLWRLGGYSSFEAYCKQRWGWEKSNAFEVANAGKTVAELKNSGVPESALPTSVAQVRQIAKLPKEKRAEVVLKIAESGEKLTAEAIKQAACNHSFEEVAALYATLPETEFLKHKNGSFNYAVNSCGYAKLYRSPDEAFEQFEWHRERVGRYLKRDEPTCARCQFCEVIEDKFEDSWYCQRHKQEYSPGENPAPNCETYAPIEYGLKPKPKAAPTLEPPPQTVVGLKFQRGDRVQISADDDLHGCSAIVERCFEIEGLNYAAIYCPEFPGIALEYLASDLSFVAGSAPSSLAELERLMIPPIQLTPQPVAVDPQPVVEPLRSEVSPEQRAAEKLLVEFKAPIAAVAKKLLSWCGDGELEEIGEWLLDEKARRKGFANYEEFADAVTEQFFEKEAS